MGLTPTRTSFKTNERRMIMNNIWIMVISASLSASLFYWIGFLKGFRSGVIENKESIRATMNSIYGCFYEMRNKNI